MTDAAPKTGALTRFLNGVERLGNRLPHITMLFIYALIIAMVFSFLLSFVEFDYIHPNTGKRIEIVNIFLPENLVVNDVDGLAAVCSDLRKSLAAVVGELMVLRK